MTIRKHPATIKNVFLVIWEFFIISHTQASPKQSKQQSKEDVAPVPLVLCCYGNNTQKEEDQSFRHTSNHLNDMPNSGAGALGYVLLNVILHSQGTDYNTVETGTQHSEKAKTVLIHFFFFFKNAVRSPYVRHDAGDGEELSYEVGQVAVQEDD